MKINVNKLLLAFFLLCLTSVGWAYSPSAYQIEIIIFSHITDEGLRSEYWTTPPPLKVSPDAVKLSSDQILPERDWRLQSVHRQLAHNQYPVLLHLAWVESANNLKHGQVVELSSDEMEGIAAIRLEHYFQVRFNCRFFLPWETIADKNLPNLTHENNSDTVSFKINESFRMRSNELNYVDHPLYGILIQITPLVTDDNHAPEQPPL